MTDRFDQLSEVINSMRIDIAQRSNPETRVAWERARQAAAAVGLRERAYYPYLAASAAAGYDRAFGGKCA